MGFGSGSTYVGETLLLEAGEYDAEISSVTECILGGWCALRIKFNVKGREGYKPDTYTLFDPASAKNEEMRKSCERKLSRFCDAVGIMLMPEGIDTRRLVGKKVKIHVAKSEKGFMEIKKICSPVTIQPMLTK